MFFFGLFFPIILTKLISLTIDASIDIKKVIMTKIVISISFMISLSILLIGYGIATFMEIEKEILII